MSGNTCLSPIFISAGANRSPNCLSWLQGKLIYGSCNAVVLVEKINGEFQITSTFSAHTDRVNCVQWLDAETFVSGSTDKTTLIWVKTKNSFKSHLVLAGHAKSVVALSAVKYGQGGALIASASGDHTIRVWEVSINKNTKECDVIQVKKNGYALAVKLCVVDNLPLLFASQDDCNIHVYVKNNEEFQPVHSLSGHEDWSHCLDVTTLGDSGDLLLASGSQDSLIRVWRLVKDDPHALKVANPGDISMKKEIVKLGPDVSFSISLETVLSGHEDKVFGVHWSATPKMNKQLLSCSMDKTMILWNAPDDTDSSEDVGGVWNESVRVGEVGGNVLGFLGAQINPDQDLATEVIGYSFNGAFHIWKQEGTGKSWSSQVPFGGHFGPVQDLAWERSGRYFLTVSSDQTTRVHAPWVRPSEKETIWREVARPQVHGYDLCCITSLPGHRFASGAEEKIVRVFDTTKLFLNNLSAITNDPKIGDAELSSAQGASVPSLGLSNKAVYENESVIEEVDKHVKDMYPDHYFIPENLKNPPAEESLIQNTLWPEIQKLYYHGYEIFCLSSNPLGSLVASASRASQAKHAEVILWENESWKIVQKLPGHNLTVTQMEFSPCGNFLLTVSRDRTWCMFKADQEGIFKKIDFTDKKTCAHSRLIWCCAWSKDSKYFVTGSRDKRLAIWTAVPDGQGSSCLKNYALPINPLVLSDSVTAVDVFPTYSGDGSLIMAVGYDGGNIDILSCNPNSGECHKTLLSLDKSESHHKTVKRLKFKERDSVIYLSSCSTDFSTKLFKCNF